jgi:two-component system LytT family sensor kinase
LVVSYLTRLNPATSRYNQTMKSWSEKVRPVLFSYLWSIEFWIVICIMMTCQQYAIERTAGTNPRFPLELLLVAERDLAFAILTPPIFGIVRLLPIDPHQPLRRTVSYLFGFVPFLICYGSIRWVFAPMWSVRLQKFVPRSFSTLRDLVALTLADLMMAYLAIVFVAQAYEYFKRARNQELERHELQQALTGSELQALKSQLHPHFLFNTLHGISTLIDTNQTRAKTMVIKLSSLLRTALQYGSADLISLTEEIAFVESYLDLEKMRLGTRLEVRWKIDPHTSSVLVPQMILQPLVENAILHGIACCQQGGWLEIASQQRNGIIEIQIRNSIGGNGRKGTGLGLKNSEARLKHLYSEEAEFSFVIAENFVATATLLFPALESERRDSRDVSTANTQR